MAEEKSSVSFVDIAKLPLISIPVGSCEFEANRYAEEFNKLEPGDPRRKETYEKWENAVHLAYWD